MRILVTNDDGVYADGLWALVAELKKTNEVVVVAPDREVAAKSGSISLYRPIRANKPRPLLDGVETYSVEGTPADSVILALGTLVKGPVDLVISGINKGSNMGDDVVISGTVGAAIQAYLLGKSALAMSVLYTDDHPPFFAEAARMAALLVKHLAATGLPDDLCLNVNYPDLPAAQVKGVCLTRPAHHSHHDAVEERFRDGRYSFFVNRARKKFPAEENSDLWAMDQGCATISPLLTNRDSHISATIPAALCDALYRDFRKTA